MRAAAKNFESRFICEVINFNNRKTKTFFPLFCFSPLAAAVAAVGPRNSQSLTRFGVNFA